MFPLFPLLEQHSESLYTSQYREAFIIRANDSSQRIELAVDILRRPAPPAHPPELALHSNRKTLDYYSDPQNMMSKDLTIEKFPLLEQHSESLYTSQYSESFWFEDDLEIEFYECNEALADDLTVGTTLTAKPLAQAKKDFAKRMAQKVNQIETLAKKLSDLEFALASSKAAVAALKAVTENNPVHIPPPSPKIEPAPAVEPPPPAAPSADKPPPPVTPPAANSSQPVWMAVLQEQEQAETAVTASLRSIRWIDILIERDKFRAPRGQGSFMSQLSLFPSRRPNSQPLASPSGMPSDAPSDLPLPIPNSMPSMIPSSTPLMIPSDQPFIVPSATPSLGPSAIQSDEPSLALQIQEQANRYLANKNDKYAIKEYTAALFLVPDDYNLSPDLHLGRAHALNGSR
jgi:hypothetical protein